MRMRFQCWASSGASARSIAWMASLVCAPARTPKTLPIRVERLAAPLQRLDGIGEGRLGRIGGDGVDLGGVRGKCARVRPAGNAPA